MVYALNSDSERGQEDPNTKMMKRLGEVRCFFPEDPLGRNATNQFNEMIAIAKAIRQRIRKRLGECLKNLENE
eukprot:TsM_000146900 transcript=TsM_000146900 gene=TsM_000146900